MNLINTIKMKKIKTLLFASILFFVTGSANAQQASLSDFIANWTGVGSDGNSYTMILNEDNSAVLKSGSSAINVSGWKLTFDDNSQIVYDKVDHTTMRLISNINATNSSTSQLTLNGNAGSNFKIYNADVFYDTGANTLTMVVDLIGTSGSLSAGSSAPVTIVFTK